MFKPSKKQTISVSNEIKNRINAEQFQATPTKHSNKMISFIKTVVTGPFTIPYSGFKKMSTFMKARPFLRYIYEGLIYLVMTALTIVLLQAETLIYSIFLYNSLANISKASNKLDATYYLKLADGLNMTNAILQAVLILCAVYLVVKHNCAFRVESKRRKDATMS